MLFQESAEKELARQNSKAVAQKRVSSSILNNVTNEGQRPGPRWQQKLMEELVLAFFVGMQTNLMVPWTKTKFVAWLQPLPLHAGTLRNFLKTFQRVRRRSATATLGSAGGSIPASHSPAMNTIPQHSLVELGDLDNFGLALLEWALTLEGDLGDLVDEAAEDRSGTEILAVEDVLLDYCHLMDFRQGYFYVLSRSSMPCRRRRLEQVLLQIGYGDFKTLSEFGFLRSHEDCLRLFDAYLAAGGTCGHQQQANPRTQPNEERKADGRLQPSVNLEQLMTHMLNSVGYQAVKGILEMRASLLPPGTFSPQ